MQSADPQEFYKRLSLTSSQLQQWLADNSQGLCHLLFDPTLRPLKDGEQFAQVLARVAPPSGEPARCIVRLPEKSIFAWQQPWVSTLDTRHGDASLAVTESLREALAELAPQPLLRGFGRRIGGWLVSPEPAKAIAAHLSRVLVQTTNSGQRMLLRLSDPAVLWPLYALLTPTQRSAAFGPIQHWWLLDPAGHPVRLERPAAESGEPDPTRLVLTAEQWADVMRLNAFNGAINRWLAEQRQYPSAAHMAHMAGVALLALRRGAAHGLADTDDLTRFAHHALTVNPEFDRHALMQDLLKRCRTPSNPSGERYGALSDELSATDWERIHTETPHAHG